MSERRSGGLKKYDRVFFGKLSENREKKMKKLFEIIVVIYERPQLTMSKNGFTLLKLV